jgi:hypothetical protein
MSRTFCGTTAFSGLDPAKARTASIDAQFVTIRNSTPVGRSRLRIDALEKPGIFRIAGKVSERKWST